MSRLDGLVAVLAAPTAVLCVTSSQCYRPTCSVLSSRTYPTWYVSDAGSRVAACSSNINPARRMGTTCKASAGRIFASGSQRFCWNQAKACTVGRLLHSMFAGASSRCCSEFACTGGIKCSGWLGSSNIPLSSNRSCHVASRTSLLLCIVPLCCLNQPAAAHLHRSHRVYTLNICRAHGRLYNALYRWQKFSYCLVDENATKFC